jgi:integrase
MGGFFRRLTCRQCGKRFRTWHGKPPVQICSCGSRDIRTGAWSIRYEYAGRKKEELIGTLTMARKVLATRMAEIADGKYGIKRQKKILFRDFALGDYWKLYAEQRLTESTRRDYWNRLHYRVLPKFGESFLHQVERRDIEAWLAGLRLELSDASVNRFLTLLKSIYRVAGEIGGIEHNPVKDIKLTREDNARIRYLSQEDYQRLIECAGAEQLRAAIILAIGTMLRRENLYGLKWSDVDMKNKKITIPASQAKGGKRIILPMIRDVNEVLTRLPRGLHSEYVLINPRTGTRYNNMHKAFETAKRKAGISNLRWHDLRHTGASWLVMSGVDLYVVQKLLGHSSIQVTERYAHLAPDYQAMQAEKLGDFLRPQAVENEEKNM